MPAQTMFIIKTTVKTSTMNYFRNFRPVIFISKIGSDKIIFYKITSITFADGLIQYTFHNTIVKVIFVMKKYNLGRKYSRMT